MRPVIKKKRIDPRYFLHETADRGVVEEQGEWKPPKEQPPEQSSSPNLPPEQPSGKRDDDDEEDRDKRKPGKQKLLKGEKSLYEKIRIAIEETFDEHLKENN